MPFSNIVSSASKDEYFREIIEYAQPFAVIGALYFENFAYDGRRRRAMEGRLEQVGQALGSIKPVLQSTRQNASSRLNIADLKDRTLATFGLFEFVEEHLGVQAQGQLNVKLVQSLELKKELLAIVDDDRAQADLRIVYLSLLIALITVRLAAFECLDSELKEINSLAREEIVELLSYRDECVRLMRPWAARRYEYTEELYSEPGLTGTYFWFLIDGEKKYAGEFNTLNPRPSISVVRRGVIDRLEDYREEAGTQALAPYRRAWLEYRRSRTELGG